MKLMVIGLIIACTSLHAESLLETFGNGSDQFQIEFVTIGNPGNIADTTGNPNPAGSVSYIYNIGKFEVSRDMVTKYNNLRGAAPAISMYDMTNHGGNGSNRPAAGISWNEAARFVNWLNSSRGFQTAYNFTTLGYNDNISLWGAGQASGSNLFRHKDAVFFLPSDNEWYKAAYGSPGGTWFNYSTGSDSAPTPVGGGTASGTAVYMQPFNQGPADINNAGGLSPYGTMAQGGNMWELIEGAHDNVNDNPTESRVLRGSPWEHVDAGYLVPNTRFGLETTNENLNHGFRVAMVPEPSSLSLLLAGGAVALARRRKS